MKREEDEMSVSFSVREEEEVVVEAEAEEEKEVVRREGGQAREGGMG